MDTEHEVDPQLEKEARSMGWKPEAEYKGDPEKWVPAEDFVERGRQVMPILRENNKRLQRDLEATRSQLTSLQQAVEDSQASIKALKEHYTAQTQRAVEAAKRSLREELKTARDTGDTEAEFKIMDQLDEIRETERAEKAKPKEEPKKEEPKKDEVPSDVRNWYKERDDWFGKDKKKTKVISRIAEDLREEGSELEGVEFLDECERLMKIQLGEIEEEEEEPRTRRPVSKVESTPSRGAPRNGAKGFSNLPRDAQQACLDMQHDLVGPNKAFKTLDEWKKNYAQTYFED